MKMQRWTMIGLFGVLLLLGGCTAGEDGASTEPPEGWETTETRWWASGVDTSRAFRDLSSLQTMGVEEEARTLGTDFAALTDEQRMRTVKEDLLALFRNQPQVVDSLFEAFAVPDLQALPADDQTDREVLKQEAYGAIRGHFEEPSTRLVMGEDVPLVYPDSLQERGVGGEVYMQVYLDEEGVPQAVALLEGAHPTLDALALRATAEMRWEPAAVYRDGTWQPVPSWVRYSIPFRAPAS